MTGVTRLRELEDAATPGPWRRAEPGPIVEGRDAAHNISTTEGFAIDEPKHHHHGWEHHPCYDTLSDGAHVESYDGTAYPASVLSSFGYDADGVDARDTDIDLIVALRNAAPFLLDLVDAARSVRCNGPDGLKPLRDAVNALDAHLAEAVPVSVPVQPTDSTESERGNG